MGMPDIVVCSLSYEPPCAGPHAGWCGDWGLDAPGYPISVHLY